MNSQVTQLLTSRFTKNQIIKRKTNTNSYVYEKSVSSRLLRSFKIIKKGQTSKGFYGFWWKISKIAN